MHGLVVMMAMVGSGGLLCPDSCTLGLFCHKGCNPDPPLCGGYGNVYQIGRLGCPYLPSVEGTIRTGACNCYPGFYRAGGCYGGGPSTLGFLVPPSAPLISGIAVSPGGSPTRPLYARLGGEPAIRAVVDDFVARTTADPKVNFFRDGKDAKAKDAKAKVQQFKTALVEFIAQVSGGPHQYHGPDLKTIQAKMQITDAQFDAAAADLSAGLDELRIAATEKSELLKIVRSVRHALLEPQAAGAGASQTR